MNISLVGIKPNLGFEVSSEPVIGEFDELKQYMSYPTFTYDLVEHGWYIRKNFPYYNDYGHTVLVVVSCKNFISPDFPFFCFADLSRALKFCRHFSPNHSSDYLNKLIQKFPLYSFDVIGDIKIKDLRLQLC